ncbi:RluA family pseudouridine synthase [Pseudobacteriovorax antillogorgiicola]|nr:RluA family pseudouridine synthase [Pseudobacteriovorax antillogorgiicola]
MQTVEILAKRGLVGKRLDLAMVEETKGLSRRKAKSLIDDGSVFVNDQRVRIASRQLSFGDRLTFRYVPDNKKKPQPVQISERDILFDQAGVIAINKPVGLPSQETKKGDRFHVVPLVKRFFQTKGRDLEHLALAHRLDKETSGVLLLGETPEIVAHLMDQFREKTIEKTYHALCYGKAQDEFEVRCRLTAINPKNGTVKVSQKSGKDSQTFFTRKEYYQKSGMSLVECRPVTGRSHQLRAHLAKVRNPIAGDKVYGDTHPKLSDELYHLVSQHHYLHARLLKFTLPGQSKKLQVKAPYPKTWQSIIELLRSPLT